MRRSVTISLPERVSRQLDEVSQQEGASRSEVVRSALSQYLALRELRLLRQGLTAEATAAGIVTDEDVFARVS